MAGVWGLLRPVPKVIAAGPMSRKALPTPPQPDDERADPSDLEFHFIRSQGEDLGIGAQGRVTSVYNEQGEVWPSRPKLFLFF
jgi:hypothetical protein